MERQVKERLEAKHRCLIPVILVTQRAEIRRIMVQSQARQTVCETLSPKALHKKGLMDWFKV
jgi:hypothetical protein